MIDIDNYSLIKLILFVMEKYAEFLLHFPLISERINTINSL